KQLAALDPDDLDVPFRRALNFVEARKLDEGEKLLVQLRERLVAAKKGEAELSQVDGQLAYIAYLRKDYDAAIKRTTPHLFDEDGVSSQSLNLLLQIARDSGNDAEGLKTLRRVLEKVD